MKNKIILLALVLAAGAIPAARADLLDNIIVDIRLGNRPPPPPPAVVVVVQDTSPRRPSAWEQGGRWYSRNQGYYYYPGGDVYYRQADHVWFYQDHGQWRSGRKLPQGAHVDFNRSVTLNMYTDRPYTYHSQVVARYPSNYFGTQVRLRDERHDDRHDNRHNDNGQHGNDNSSHGNDHDGRDSDHDGRDKDKGNHK